MTQLPYYGVDYLIRQVDKQLVSASNFGVLWTAGRIAARRVFKQQETNKDEELGTLLTSQLDEMKGMAMKIGQILSYMDVPIPNSVQQKLTHLQKGQKGLSTEATKAALVSALGSHWRDCFESFEIKPFAAASIGQVHRATVEGQSIVLKILYPEVSKSIQRDMSTLQRLASFASLASSVDGQSIVDELASRFEEECDYTREALFQSQFKKAFENDPRIEIPDILPRLCTSTTLASSWVDALSFEMACGQASELRNKYALALTLFSYRSLLEFALIQADPHPGNFLFKPDGKIVCLDFGCIRSFDPNFIQLLRQMLIAIKNNNRKSFRDVVIDLGMAPKPKYFDFEHHFAAMSHLHRPILTSPFSFTSEFLREGLAYNGPSSPNARYLNIPPAYVWVARLQWGLWSLLNKLQATIDLPDHMNELLQRPITALTKV